MPQATIDPRPDLYIKEVGNIKADPAHFYLPVLIANRGGSDSGPFGMVVELIDLKGEVFATRDPHCCAHFGMQQKSFAKGEERWVNIDGYSYLGMGSGPKRAHKIRLALNARYEVCSVETVYEGWEKGKKTNCSTVEPKVDESRFDNNELIKVLLNLGD